MISCFGHAQGEENEKGPLLLLDFSRASNDPGRVYKLNPAAGYKFNGDLEVGCGWPVYFVRIPNSATSSGLFQSNGIGNAYLDPRFLRRPSDFLQQHDPGAAPAGKAKKGFCSGRATIDRTNSVERSFGLRTQFGTVGIAKATSDNHFSSRPLSSLGLAASFEGGMSVEPVHRIRVAGSRYSGQARGTAENLQQGSAQATGPTKGKGRNKFFWGWQARQCGQGISPKFTASPVGSSSVQPQTSPAKSDEAGVLATNPIRFPVSSRSTSPKCFEEPVCSYQPSENADSRQLPISLLSIPPIPDRPMLSGKVSPIWRPIPFPQNNRPSARQNPPWRWRQCVWAVRTGQESNPHGR